MNGKILLVVAFVALQQVCMGMNFAEPKLIPAPREFKFAADRCAVLDSNTVLSVACPDVRGGEWAARHFKEWFGAEPRMKTTAGGAALPEGDEAYALVVDSTGVGWGGSDPIGGVKVVEYKVFCRRRGLPRGGLPRVRHHWWTKSGGVAITTFVTGGNVRLHEPFTNRTTDR